METKDSIAHLIEQLDDIEELPALHIYNDDELLVKIGFPSVQNVDEYSLALNQAMIHVSSSKEYDGVVLFVEGTGHNFIIVAQYGHIHTYRYYTDGSVVDIPDNELDNFTVYTILGYLEHNLGIEVSDESRDALLERGFQYAEMV